MADKNFLIRSFNGAIEIDITSSGSVSITQNGRSIYVTPVELENLAKGMFAFKNQHYPKPQSPPKPKPSPNPKAPSRGKQFLDEQKAKHQNAYERWTAEDDELLKELFKQGKSVEEIAERLGRNAGSITARLKKHNLTWNN